MCALYAGMEPVCSWTTLRVSKGRWSVQVRVVCACALYAGMEPVCSWTTLRVSKGQWHATDDWQWLPWPAEGTLTVELPKNAYLDILLPLTETVSVAPCF